MNDLFDSLEAAAINLRDMDSQGDAIDAANRIVRRYRDAVTVDVIRRSQVGACIPFTPLPKHYLGKKVRIVIVGEADE
ncbi:MULTISPECIES: hypothetical protein [Stenotrophomonas maltophilia group]|uniref:hypothetical protein n=1 Tax=Stenotrophomonas maltophilia group TaxID=995085 RepID=UPI0013DD29EA|nr:hypothetical protein [Stenotrophomonas maltophilia]